MNTTEFVDNFCGPDRDAFRTVLECEIYSLSDIYDQMQDMMRSRQITERDGSDARVNLSAAVDQFTDRLLDDIQDRNENS